MESDLVRLLPAMPILLVALFGIMFLCFPERIVRLQVRYARAQYRGFSDEQIDGSGPLMPWERYTIGSKSKFVRHGVESPEQFPRLIRYYRLQGLAALLLAACGLVVMFFGFSG